MKATRPPKPAIPVVGTRVLIHTAHGNDLPATIARREPVWGGSFWSVKVKLLDGDRMWWPVQDTRWSAEATIAGGS